MEPSFIHRVEFGEVSGHRVLIKRGPGNRGPKECGTTHEATAGEPGHLWGCTESDTTEATYQQQHRYINR